MRILILILPAEKVLPLGGRSSFITMVAMKPLEQIKALSGSSDYCFSGTPPPVPPSCQSSQPLSAVCVANGSQSTGSFIPVLTGFPIPFKLYNTDWGVRVMESHSLVNTVKPKRDTITLML